MPELDTLFLILGALYLFECLVWLPTGAVLLAAHFPGRYAARRRTPFLQNDRGGLYPAYILPMGHAVRVAPWPFSASPAGLCAYVTTSLLPFGRPYSTERVLRFEEILSIKVDGTRLLINETLFAKASSAQQAAHLADLLKSWQALEADDRALAIERALYRSCAIEEIRVRFEACRQSTRLLVVANLSLLLYLFACLPAFISYFGQGFLSVFVLGYFCLLLWNAVAFWMAHARLHPTSIGARWRKLALLLLSPADAIHSRGSLLREECHAYHPLAVAAILCTRNDFEDFAAWVLRDQEHPQPPCRQIPDLAPPGAEVEDWFQAQLKGALKRLVGNAGFEMRGLFDPPLPEDGRCRSYCPRCLGQYELTQGTCSTCRCSLTSLKPASALGPR